MPIFQPRIAIVGGGPSGLALGQLLHQRGIRATIYELRAKSTQEELAKPSGMLDLHEESGLTAMRECGLWNGFQAAVGDCSESMRVINPDGVVLHTDEGELASRPEIARNALTNLLIQNVPSDTIKWNHKITTVRSDHNATTGATEITFDLGVNGAAAYDFVVGADGAWSRIRKLLSDAQPFYSGAQYVTATVRHVSTKYPHLVELSGSGTLCALGGGNAIMTQRGPQDSIQVYAAVSTPHEHWAAAAGLKGKTAAEVKTTLLGDDKLFRKWAPALQDLLATACDEETKDNPGCEADIKPYYMLPVGHRWEHRTGATLIGDAAHLMTPWAGEGVNLALWDSLDLAHVLAAVPEAADAAAWQAALEPRMREFEEAMLARAQVKAEETVRNKDMFLSENGAQAMADFFKMYEDIAAAGHKGSKMETVS
ncbi:salicylate hydroxylase [Cenococcum geophilum 1.58]|uniref:salicylate hydroxylase n=1 Tax=Cenococcum geophilum 1.58 TaxID=794803 RepID=UPI00358F55DA|nr:salicylate hydroxylase [Cenococcum geophilum 1.58]